MASERKCGQTSAGRRSLNKPEEKSWFLVFREEDEHFFHLLRGALV